MTRRVPNTNCVERSTANVRIGKGRFKKKKNHWNYGG